MLVEDAAVMARLTECLETILNKAQVRQELDLVSLGRTV